jgi:transposase
VSAAPTRDPEQIIKQLRDELARTNADRERLQEDLARAERERERLRRENERLRHELEAARRAGFRQAAPFSKGMPIPHPRRPGRKPGMAYGRHGRRSVPLTVTDTYDAPVPRTCPDCGGTVDDTRVAVQYQEDLPPVRPLVRRFDVHVGRCRRCGRRVQGRHPLQTSDALGAAAVQIGPEVVATAAVLNKQLGLSFGKVATLFAERFGVTVVPSAIVRALHRAATKALPTYAALVQTVRTSPMVVPDETGWRVHAELQWLWACVTPTTTVYAILPGRGFEEAACLLGASFAGILIRDGWAPYRQFTEAAHQTCLTHLVRRARELREDHPRALLPGQVTEVLQEALDIRDRHAIGTISAHGTAVARGRLIHRLSTLLDQPTGVTAVRRFIEHLNREWTALFSCLFDLDIDATNYRAEHAIRWGVVTRKMCGGGNRTTRGAVTQYVLASVLRTARQRGLDRHAVFAAMLRTRTPIVSHAFQPRAGPR